MFELLGRGAAEAVDRTTDVRALTDDDVLAAVRAIESARHRLDAAESRLLAELDLRGTTDARYGLRTAGWVSRTCGRGPRGRVTTLLRVGSQLRRHLPATDAALASGRITFDHARALADAANPRIADQLAGPVEDELVDLAGRCTFRRWRDHVNQVVELLDADGGHDPNADLERNRLTLSPMLDGMIGLDGRLVGIGAETVRQAVTRVADELFEQYRRDHDTTGGAVTIPPPAALRALALVELIRRANAAGAVGVAPSPEVTLVINADDIDPGTGETGQAFTPTGVRLAGGHLCSLTCDMSIFPIIRNSLGVPLDMGRAIRTATSHQRRALAARDGGCVFPGCDAHPERCQAHHVDHWIADLGRTDVRRMVFLCPHHHGVVHRTGWKLSIDPEGWAVITTPDGLVLAGQRHGITRAGPAPPMAA